jgi:uncharacterized membrane protein YbhN (UPF0104 family)
MLSQKFYFISFYKQKANQLDFIRTEFIIQFLDIVIPIPNIEDVLRTIFLKSIGNTVKKALSLVLINRTIGILSFLTILSVSSFYSFNFYYDLLHDKINTKVLILATIVIGVVALVGLALSSVYFNFNWKDLSKKMLIDSVKEHLNFFRLAVAFVYSNLHYLFWIFSIFFMIKAIHMDISLFNIMLIIPLLILSFLVPFSYQGLGLPETTLFLYLNFLGFLPELSFSVAFIHFINYLIVIILGGILFLISNTFKINNLRI